MLLIHQISLVQTVIADITALQPATGCTIQSRSPHNTGGSCDFSAGNTCGYVFNGYWYTHSGKYDLFGASIPGTRTSGKLFLVVRLEECFPHQNYTNYLTGHHPTPEPKIS